MANTKDLQETKELRIVAPEGYEIDEENSTFGCIKFKPVKKSKFSDYDDSYIIEGWDTAGDKIIYRPPQGNSKFTKDTFATEKYAKSALAMAQISQIMANDERFGGAVTDKEWDDYWTNKYCLIRYDNKVGKDVLSHTHHFLAFHTEKHRDRFLKENEQLVKDYLMID